MQTPTRVHRSPELRPRQTFSAVESLAIYPYKKGLYLAEKLCLKKRTGGWRVFSGGSTISYLEWL